MEKSNLNPIVKTDVCIVGGGPAGAFLAYLALKDGLNVTLVEITKKFERSFRGEGITPGGVHILKQSGIFDLLSPEDYRIIEGMRLFENGKKIFEAKFEILKNKNKLGIDIPQPTLLNTIANECEKFDSFTFLRGVKPKEVLRNENNQITGVRLNNDTEINSKLVVGADGRYSSMIKLGDFEQKRKDYKRDVIWFKLPKTEDYIGGWYTNVRIIKETHLIILPAYPDLLRVGVYLPKNGFKQLKKDGLEKFYEKIDFLEPRFSKLVREHVKSFKDISLLDIFSSKVTNWAKDGMILIGDAAHTCSPILGQGVNLALRDSYELSKELKKMLANPEQGIIKGVQLDSFVKRRKKDISFIQNFQNRNEKLLSYGTSHGAAYRRFMYKILNVLPTKPFIMSRVAEGSRKVLETV